MIEYIKIFAPSILSVITVYITSRMAMGNIKQGQYYEEKRKLYYELATILPNIESFKAQSDYMDGTEGNCNAYMKITIMEQQLKDAKKRKHKFEHKIDRFGETMSNLENQISDLNYKIENHKQYLSQMQDIFEKIQNFQKKGNENVLLIFASSDVRRDYKKLKAALHNEFCLNIGVKKEDIIYNINSLIENMKKDLSK